MKKKHHFRVPIFKDKTSVTILFSLLLTFSLLTTMYPHVTNANSMTQQPITSPHNQSLNNQSLSQDNKSNNLSYPKNEKGNVLKNNKVGTSKATSLFGNDPAVVSVWYVDYNTKNVTTWSVPGGSICIYFTIKGPLSAGDTLNIYLVEHHVNSLSLVYATRHYTVNEDLSETQLITVNISDPIQLDSDASVYGNTFNKIDAYYLKIAKQEIIGETVIYDGADNQTQYLHMWGNVAIDSVTWYRTYSGVSYKIGQSMPGWQIYPKIRLVITDGPLWDVTLTLTLMFDKVWWIDSNLSSVTNSFNGTYTPGVYEIVFNDTSGQTKLFTLPTSETYGNGFQQIRGVYAKISLDSSEIYSGDREGTELPITSNIQNLPPYIDLLYPSDGQVIVGNKTELAAQVLDPNGPYDISKIYVYVDDIKSDITSFYDVFSQILDTEIKLPDKFGVPINITIVVIDSVDNRTSTTIFVFRVSDTFFPNGYTLNSTEMQSEAYKKTFTYRDTFMWTPNEDYNVTLTPIITFSISVIKKYQLDIGAPHTLQAGDNFTLLVRMTNPMIELNITYSLGFEYYIYAKGSKTFGIYTLFTKSWTSAVPLPVGISILDLRYDIPGVSEYIRQLTTFEISVSEIIPYPISWLCDLILRIDIVPRLKLFNSISADLGLNGTVIKGKSLTWYSSEYIAVMDSVLTSVNGLDKIAATIDNASWNCVSGMDIGVNLTLTGTILGFEVKSVNLNAWMANHLGIIIPTYHLWFPNITLSFSSSKSPFVLYIPVTPTELDVNLAFISANESGLQIYVSVQDKFGNNITNANVYITADNITKLASPTADGLYTAIFDVVKNVNITVSVNASASGYIPSQKEFTVYIDPTLVDSTPPIISDVTFVPENPTENESVKVSAVVTDTLSGVNKVILSYYYNDSWHNITMSLNTTNSKYEATIPAEPAGSKITFSIYAFDNAGNIASSGPYEYSVVEVTHTQGGGTAPTNTTSSQPQGGGSEASLLTGSLGLMFAAGAGVTAVVVIFAILRKRK